MKRYVLCLIVATTAPALFAADGLYRLEVKSTPVENAKTLEMSFFERARYPHESEVEVVFVSGGSVSSSMFVLKGMCGLARQRGENYFRSDPIDKQQSDRLGDRFRVVFVKTPPPDAGANRPGAVKVWSLTECAVVGF